MASVHLDQLSVRYPNGTLGLADIDLHVHDGEFVALLGPSGSGKTTLLRTIAGFLSPSAGTVRLGERLVAGPSTFVEPEKRHLGMVFQQHAVWPHWSVQRNVEYPLKLARVPRAQRQARAREVLALVGLDGFEKRNPATLSGGQRQRVAIARALVGDPRVLLLDEALSALDEPLRDRLRMELQQLVRRFGLTVVHVTHDRNEALALADRVVVLDGGRIQQVGTPAELVEAPASSFVAGFLSDAAIISGSLDADGFRTPGHPLVLSRDLIVGDLGPGAAECAAGIAVEIAITPEQVRLSPATESQTPAIVVSSLYGRGENDVTVDWAGIRLRSRVPGYRPVVGERVSVTITRAMAYPVATPIMAARTSPATS